MCNSLHHCQLVTYTLSLSHRHLTNMKACTVADLFWSALGQCPRSWLILQFQVSPDMRSGQCAYRNKQLWLPCWSMHMAWPDGSTLNQDDAQRLCQIIQVCSRILFAVISSSTQRWNPIILHQKPSSAMKLHLVLQCRSLLLIIELWMISWICLKSRAAQKSGRFRMFINT